MANIPETRNLCYIDSTSSIVPMTSDLEQILRGTDDLSIVSTLRNPPHAVSDLAVNLKAALEADDEGPPFSPTQRSKPAPDVAHTIQELLHYLHLCTSMRKIVQEEARHIHALETDKFSYQGHGRHVFIRILHWLWGGGQWTQAPLALQCGDYTYRNGAPWMITRNVCTKDWEADKSFHAHGRLHKPRFNIVSVCTLIRDVHLRNDWERMRQKRYCWKRTRTQAPAIPNFFISFRLICGRKSAQKCDGKNQGNEKKARRQTKVPPQR